MSDIFSITEFHAQNFRGIQDLSVTLNSGVNLIVGSNGCGKSSLVNAIRKFLSHVFMFTGGLGASYIQPEDIFVSSNMSGDVTAQVKPHYPVVVDGTLQSSDASFPLEMAVQNGGPAEDIRKDDAARYFMSLLDRQDSIYPLFDFFSADRQYTSVKLSTIQLESKPYERKDGYRNSLDGNNAEAFLNAETWCMQMELAEFQRRKPVREYQKFKKAVLQFFQKIEPRYSLKDIYFSTQYATMVFVSVDGSETPVYNLSDGFKYLYAMAMELFYRAALLNPQEDFRIEDSIGTVIIDEIDMHLHPNWQWRILDALQGLLPKVQFIIATHSPMVISSAKNVNIIRMFSPDEVKIESGMYGSSMEDVLSLVQDSDSYPEGIQKLYDELQTFIEDGKLSDARKLLGDIENQFGSGSAESRAAHDYYEMNKWIGEGADDSD